MRTDGAAEMSSDILLYPAIFIFSMLIVGLIFTVIEFKNISKKSNQDERDKK